MDESEESPRQPDTDPSIYLLMSLFLVLLAFFIILSTTSRVDKSKAAGALQSLNQTFAEASRSLDGFPAFGHRMERIVARQEFQDQIREIFGPENLPLEGGLEAKVTQSDDLLEVIVPADALFRDTSLRPERTGLADRLAGVLARPRAGLRTFIDCIALTPAEAGELPTRPVPEVARAVAFVQALQERGVAGGVAAVGLQSGDPHLLRFLFRIRGEDE